MHCIALHASHLNALHCIIAQCIAGHQTNIGYVQALEPKQEPNTSTLEGHRLQHVQIALRKQQEQQSSSSASLDETKVCMPICT